MTDPLADGWEPVEDSSFIGLVGPIVRRARGDDDEYGFVAEPKHANLNDVVQGGMLMTFADRALGYTAWRVAGRSTATVQFDMQFVSAARIGEFIQMRPEVVRRTSALVFLRGALFAGARIVATAQGVWKILG